MAEMDFNATQEDDVFLFDPTVADDVAELACLDDLDLDWSDLPSSLGLGDDVDIQEPHLVAPRPADDSVDATADAAEIDPLPLSAGSVEKQPTALRTGSTVPCGTTGSTITNSTNRTSTMQRASDAHCMPTTDNLDGNTEARKAEKSFLGFSRKKEHLKSVGPLPSASAKVPSAVVSNVDATKQSSSKPKVFPDPVRSEGKAVFLPSKVGVGNSSLDTATIKGGGFSLPPSASSNEGSISGDASAGGGSSTNPPPTAEEAAAEARRRRVQRREILDQKRRARRQKRQHQHSPPTMSSSGASTTGERASPPAAATEVAAIAQKLLVNASSPPPRPPPAVVIPSSVSSTSPSPSPETLPTRASSHPAGAGPAPSAAGARPAKPPLSVPPAPKAKRAPAKSKPMSPPSTITFTKEAAPTEAIPSSSLLLADEDVTELTEDMLPKGTDPESRKQRRLIRNRLSAALHRKRKRETLDNQKKMIEDRDDAIADLRGQLEKMTARCKSLETDLGVIIRCYGASQINRILEDSRSGLIPRGGALVTDSPPHLVNISSSSSGGSGSDRSTCSEDSPSPPPSPTHESSRGESEVEEKQPGTTTTAVAPRKGNNNNKRKRAVLTGLGFYPAVATVAMCGLLGCMMLPPSVLRNPEQEVEPPSSSSVAVNPHSEGGEGRRRLQAVFPSEDDEEEKAISRWSNLESKWPGLDPDQLLGDGGEGGGSKRHTPSTSWVISPIEMYPSLWTVDERISKTPWTVERSIQLFDFRSSKISPASASAAGGVPEGSSVLPLRLFPDAYPLKTPPGRESKTSSSPTRMLRGGAVVETTVVTDQTEASDNGRDGNMDYEYVDADDADDADMDSAESSARDEVIGSSFMFCPAASAVFSPGLLQLAGISGDTTGRGKDGQGRADDAASHWQWGGTFSDNDQDDDMLHSSATQPSPYPVATLNSLMGSPVVEGDDTAFDDYYRHGSPTTSGDDAGSDESKALVPTYLDYYRKKLLTTFSASSSEFSSHSGGGNGGGVPIIKTVLGGDDPYMTILVPASAISGGGAAADFSDPRSSGNRSPRWLELGCQVLSARVVDGVNFVGDPTPLRHHDHEDGEEDEE